MTDMEQRTAAKAFAADWEGRGDEKQETQSFWMSLLQKVYGVAEPDKFIDFEVRVMLGHTSFIDGFIKDTRVLIEQKGKDIDLRRGYRQSDGSMLTPYQQARRYAGYLPHDQNPRWIVVCNFQEFHIHDMNRPNDEPEVVLLADLEREYSRLNFLVDTGDENIKREMAISMEAGKLVGKLYDAFHERYNDRDSERALKSLNMLCVRLVFCLYAEDSGIFGRNNMFHDYMRSNDVRHARQALIDLFKVLDTPYENRAAMYLDEDLAAFPYVNGGLFSDEDIEIPNFTQEIYDLLLSRASEDFNWRDISPTIFGAVFESTLNPETRRKGGMHYTSIENIHKVIDPLFLDALQAEYAEISNIQVHIEKKRRLHALQDKMASLTFLDPACGSGNFLTESYLSLRRLENKVIQSLIEMPLEDGRKRGKSTSMSAGQIALLLEGDITPIKVSIGQFYGIEINDFAVTVAKTALWIAESQMMKQTEDIVHMNLDFLPLKSYVNIVESNALRIDWEAVVPKDKLSYIMGNPPFVGASMMSREQKDEAVAIFGTGKLSNSIDYVGAWYHKAAALIQNTHIRVALVSTNSITQGEQIAPLWKPLFEKYNIQIIFAHRTFRWDSEANLKAHVHCVIIGFCAYTDHEDKNIYEQERKFRVNSINAYLLDAPNVFVESRSTPLCDVPKMTKGNQPTDGGHFILSSEERDKLIQEDETVSVCIRRYIGAKDFLNNNEVRYCLWLKGISPTVYRKNKEIQRRLSAIKEFRESSSAAPTRKAAEKAFQFFSTPQTEDTYLIIPRHSSEKRKYIPIGFMTPDNIASDACAIICNAKLYHFGVLTSNVHNAWMRTVAGRLEMRYRYSGAIVYNNFPWPTPTNAQKAAIESTAKGILDARALYPNCSLADLYDEVTMPVELRRAHQQNDKAVMEAYGMSIRDTTESSCVAELMRRYQELTR